MTECSVKKPNIGLVMAGVMLSIFISSLDNTITGTAMPRIVSELKGIEFYSLPFSIYMLFSTVAIPIFGKVSDSYGRKLAFHISIIVFVAASIMCGSAANMIQLIIFRGIQGIGGGSLIANSFIVVAELFPPAERAKYMGMAVSAFGLSSILGPVLGGIITESFGWRWIFLINLPLGLIAFYLVAVSLPDTVRNPNKASLDIGGIATFVLAVIPLFLLLTCSGKYFSFLSIQGIGMLIMAIIMFALFLRIEAKAKDPIIPLKAFKNPILSVSVICVFFISTINFGTVMLIPLFLQGVKGISPIVSGAYITPMLLSLLVTSAVTGLIITKTGRYKALAVIACIIISLAFFMLQTMNSSTASVQIIINMIILGIGIGITMPVFDLASQNAFPQSQVGFVTSMIQFTREIGGAAGTAILGAIMTISINKSLAVESLFSSGKSADADTLAVLGNTIESLGQIDSRKASDIIGNSIHNALIAGVIISGFLILTALFLKEAELKKSNNDALNDAKAQIVQASED